MRARIANGPSANTAKRTIGAPIKRNRITSGPITTNSTKFGSKFHKYYIGNCRSQIGHKNKSKGITTGHIT